MHGLIDPHLSDVKEPAADGLNSGTYQHVDPSPNPLYDVANVPKSNTASNPIYFNNLELNREDENKDCYDTLQRDPMIKNLPHQNLNKNATGNDYRNIGINPSSEYNHLGDGTMKAGKTKRFSLELENKSTI